MTRAEYEAKYGKAPVVSRTPVQMTRAEYEAKYNQKPTVSLGQKVLNAGTAVTNFLGGKAVQETFGAELAKIGKTQAEKDMLSAEQPSIGQTTGSALQLGSLFIPGTGVAKVGTLGAKALGASARIAPIIGSSLAGGAVGATYDIGEKLQTGKTSGLGTVTGLALPLIGPAISKARGLAAPALERSAETSIMKALAPTTKGNKAVAEKVTKEILDRPIGDTFAFTRGGLEKKAGEAREVAGEAINEYGALTGKSKTSEIIKALETEKGQYSAGGVVVNKEAVDKLNKVQNIILEYGDSIENETLRDVRKIFDAEIKKSKGFMIPPSEGSLIDAKKIASDKIRGILAEADPNIAKLNKEYTFWANLDTVIGDTNKRIAPQSGLGRDLATLGGAVSAVDGGAMNIAMKALTFRWLSGLVKSTGWRLASARVKDKIANAIAISDFTTANKILNTIDKTESPFVKEYKGMFTQKPNFLPSKQIQTPIISAPNIADIPKVLPQSTNKVNILEGMTGPKGKKGAIKPFVGLPEGYKETGNLTTKILKDLEGKTTVSKQYILDATNRGELKQAERDITRQVLETIQGDKVDVKEFADKIKSELLPLKADPLLSEALKYKNGKDFYELSGSKVNQQLREKGIRGQEQVTKYWEEITGKKSVNSYAMSHRPQEMGAGYNIDEIGNAPNFYENPEYFKHSKDGTYDESIRALLKIKGKPEAEVTVYRASPKSELNKGDWISLSKKYAQGESLSEDTKVHSFKVKAKDIQFAGDDINEFGYFPK